MSKKGASPNEMNKFPCKICGVSFDTQKELDVHYATIESQAKSDLSIQDQYERFAQDWRQIHTVVWGIPNVAVAILTGVIVAAYQDPLNGWPRIIVLSVGSILLFALTVELVEKRIFMNAITARMITLEEDNNLKPFRIRKHDIKKELDDYDERMAKRDPNRPPSLDRDIPTRLFRLSHAREGLTYVVFVSAIILTALSYFEFVTFLHYTVSSYFYGIIPIIVISALIAAIRIWAGIKEDRNKNTGSG